MFLLIINNKDRACGKWQYKTNDSLRYWDKFTLCVVIDFMLMSIHFLVMEKNKFDRFFVIIAPLYKMLRYDLISFKSFVEVAFFISSILGFGISFMYIAKNKGPNTKTCGKLHSASLSDDLTLYRLLVRYVLKKSLQDLVSHTCSNLI